MELKVLIADDDDGIRLVIRKILEKHDGFELVGEAADGEAALHLTEALKPNIVFLDVEMPILTGIECAKKIIDINPKTFIIFATAHEEYMPEAFELYASDYIIKPFKVERINQTLDRIKSIQREHDVISLSRIIRQEKRLDKLMIRNKDGVSLVDMEDIVLIQREDRSTVVYTSNDRYVTSDGLSELEGRLDKSIFFRSHKSYIINLSLVHKIYPYGRWTYIVKLKNTDKDALLTHDKFEEMEKMFK